MSMMPDPRYCPMEAKNSMRGIPKRRERKRNWTRKTAPNSTVRTANRETENIPMVAEKAANKKLKL